MSQPDGRCNNQLDIIRRKGKKNRRTHRCLQCHLDETSFTNFSGNNGNRQKEEFSGARDDALSKNIGWRNSRGIRGGSKRGRTCVIYWYVLFHGIRRGVADVLGREKFSVHLLKCRQTKGSVVVGGNDIMLGDVKRLRGLETFNAGLDV